MKVLILYRSRSEQAHIVESFVHDFEMQHSAGRIELVDADSREGIATATLYDVMQYPTVLALREDGAILKSWEGEQLPLMNEIAYYASS